MYLLFDLSTKDVIHLALFDTKELHDAHASGSNCDLLASLDSFLTKQGFRKEDIEGIMVVVGAGGFTSTRLACVVANTFGYVLNIPLLAITEDQVWRVQELISELLRQPRGQYVTALYSGGPHITVAE